MIEIIKNILPDVINKRIIFLLIQSDRWKLAKDNLKEIDLVDYLTNSKGKDFGNYLQTFDEKNDTYIDTPLNFFAEIIYEIIKEHTKYKFLKPIRFIWNYYNNSSSTDFHKDREDSFYLSFVYSLNTNDGGTEIDGNIYPSISGQAILFPSNILHRGLPPINTKGRFNFNCVVELERILK